MDSIVVTPAFFLGSFSWKKLLLFRFEIMIVFLADTFLVCSKMLCFIYIFTLLVYFVSLENWMNWCWEPLKPLEPLKDYCFLLFFEFFEFWLYLGCTFPPCARVFISSAWLVVIHCWCFVLSWNIFVSTPGPIKSIVCYSRLDIHSFLYGVCSTCSQDLLVLEDLCIFPDCHDKIFL